jgi:hypothetical protein
MKEEKEIISEYFTKHYPEKRKIVINEVDVGVAGDIAATASAGATGLGTVIGFGGLAIIALIVYFLFFNKKPNYGYYSNSISDDKFFRETNDSLEKLMKNEMSDEDKESLSQYLKDIKSVKKEDNNILKFLKKLSEVNTDGLNKETIKGIVDLTAILTDLQNKKNIADNEIKLREIVLKIQKSNPENKDIKNTSGSILNSLENKQEIINRSTKYQKLIAKLSATNWGKKLPTGFFSALMISTPKNEAEDLIKKSREISSDDKNAEKYLKDKLFFVKEDTGDGVIIKKTDNEETNDGKIESSGGVLKILFNDDKLKDKFLEENLSLDEKKLEEFLQDSEIKIEYKKDSEETKEENISLSNDLKSNKNRELNITLNNDGTFKESKEKTNYKIIFNAEYKTFEIRSKQKEKDADKFSKIESSIFEAEEEEYPYIIFTGKYEISENKVIIKNSKKVDDGFSKKEPQEEVESEIVEPKQQTTNKPEEPQDNEQKNAEKKPVKETLEDNSKKPKTNLNDFIEKNFFIFTNKKLEPVKDKPSNKSYISFKLEEGNREKGTNRRYEITTIIVPEDSKEALSLIYNENDLIIKTKGLIAERSRSSLFSNLIKIFEADEKAPEDFLSSEMSTLNFKYETKDSIDLDKINTGDGQFIITNLFKNNLRSDIAEKIFDKKLEFFKDQIKSKKTYKDLSDFQQEIISYSENFRKLTNNFKEKIFDPSERFIQDNLSDEIKKMSDQSFQNLVKLKKYKNILENLYKKDKKYNNLNKGQQRLVNLIQVRINQLHDLELDYDNTKGEHSDINDLIKNNGEFKELKNIPNKDFFEKLDNDIQKLNVTNIKEEAYPEGAGIEDTEDAVEPVDSDEENLENDEDQQPASSASKDSIIKELTDLKGISAISFFDADIKDDNKISLKQFDKESKKPYWIAISLEKEEEDKTRIFKFIIFTRNKNEEIKKIDKQFEVIYENFLQKINAKVNALFSGDVSVMDSEVYNGKIKLVGDVLSFIEINKIEDKKTKKKESQSTSNQEAEPEGEEEKTPRKTLSPKEIIAKLFKFLSPKTSKEEKNKIKNEIPKVIEDGKINAIEVQEIANTANFQDPSEILINATPNPIKLEESSDFKSFKGKKLNHFFEQIFSKEVKKQFFYNEQDDKSSIEKEKAPPSKITTVDDLMDTLFPSNVFVINLNDGENKIKQVNDFSENVFNELQNGIIFYKKKDKDFYIGQLKIKDLSIFTENKVLLETYFDFNNENEDLKKTLNEAEEVKHTDILSGSPCEVNIESITSIDSKNNIITNFKITVIKRGIVSSNKFLNKYTKIDKEEDKKLIKDTAKKDLEEKPIQDQKSIEQKEVTKTAEVTSTDQYFISLDDIKNKKKTVTDTVSGEAGIIFTKTKNNFIGYLWLKELNKVDELIGFNEIIALQDYFNFSLQDFIITEEIQIKDYRNNFISSGSLIVEIVNNEITKIISKGNIKDFYYTKLEKSKQDLLKSEIEKTSKEAAYKKFGLTDLLTIGTETEEQAVESPTGFISLKESSKIGNLIPKNYRNIDLVLSKKDFKVYYFIKSSEDYYYIEIDKHIFYILSFIIKNFKFTFGTSNSIINLDKDLVNGDIKLKDLKMILKTQVPIDKNIKKLKFKFGKLEEKIVDGNKISFKFPINTSLQPKIGEPKKIPQENKKPTVESIEKYIIESIWKK